MCHICVSAPRQIVHLLQQLAQELQWSEDAIPRTLVRFAEGTKAIRSNSSNQEKAKAIRQEKRLRYAPYSLGSPAPWREG